MGNLFSCCSSPERKEETTEESVTCDKNSTKPLANETKISMNRKDFSEVNIEGKEEEQVARKKPKEEPSEEQKAVIKKDSITSLTYQPEMESESELPIVKLTRILFFRVQVILVAAFETFSEALKKNAVDETDRQFYYTLTKLVVLKPALTFIPIPGIQDEFEIPKIEEIFKSCKEARELFKNTKQAKEIQRILMDQELEPEENIKEMAKGMIEVCSALEMLLRESLIKEEKIQMIETELMAKTMASIILNYLIKEKPNKLTWQVIVDAFKNFEMDKSGVIEKIQKLPWLKRLKQPQVAFTAIYDLDVQFQEGKSLKVNPQQLICGPLVLNKNMDEDGGVWFKPNKVAKMKFCYKIPAEKEGTDAEVDDMKSENLSKFGFRLLFPEEKLEDDKYRAIKPDKRNAEMDKFKHGKYTFHLKQLTEEDKEELVKKMCNLKINDEETATKIKELIKITTELIKTFEENSKSTNVEPSSSKFHKKIEGGTRKDDFSCDTITRSDGKDILHETINTNVEGGVTLTSLSDNPNFQFPDNVKDMVSEFLKSKK